MIAKMNKAPSSTNSTVFALPLRSLLTPPDVVLTLHPLLRIAATCRGRSVQTISCRGMLEFRATCQGGHAEEAPQHIAQLNVLADEAAIAIVALAHCGRQLILGKTALAEDF